MKTLLMLESAAGMAGIGLAWIGILSSAFAQPPTAPLGDVFQSGGQGEAPAQAAQTLYKLTAQITDDPSFGYQTPRGDQTDRPEITAAQRQWYTAMASQGNTLSQKDRARLVPCVAHLNAAIDAMERGYRIQKSQTNNSAAQKTVQTLYTNGRKEFSLCSSADANGTGNNGGGSGTPGVGSGTPISGSGQPQPPGKNKPIQGGIGSGTGATPPPPKPQNPVTTAGGNNPPGTGTGGTPGGGPSGSSPSNALTNSVDYIRGVMAGLGDGIKGFGDLLVGAAYFADGVKEVMQGRLLTGHEFENAARAWGLTPGDSITLKGIASELNTKVVGQNVSAYDQGKTAGRRIFNYAAVPGATKALGGVPRAPARVPPAASAVAPIKGAALLEATTEAPKSLVGKLIDAGDGPVQLGDNVGGGNFGQVYRLPKQPNSMIKLGTSKFQSAESFPRQKIGSERLKKLEIDTPTIDKVTPGGPDQAASLVMDDVKSKWPGAKQYSPSEFNALPPAERTLVTNAIQNVYKKLVSNGYIWPDGSLNNMMFRRVGSGMSAIVHDADMIMNLSEMQKDIAANGVPAGVVRAALESLELNGILERSFTVQEMMNDLYKVRFGGNLFDDGGGTPITRRPQ